MPDFRHAVIGLGLRRGGGRLVSCATGDVMAAAEEATDGRLAAAHRALRAAGDTQFDLPPVAPRAPPPGWLRSLGAWLEWALAPVARFLGWITSLMPDAPYARIFLWTVIAVLAMLALWMAIVRIREGTWRLPRWRRRRALAGEAGDVDEAWTPDAAPARAWLAEADRFAAEGRYAEAVHHILLRSIEDIARRRPQAIRPALTSRDIARANAVPEAPRRLFADLAAVVERSLFGGRAVAAEEWTRCRAAYAEFALPGSWRG